MKLKFFVALVVIADALTRRTPAQTNDTKDLRKVGGEVYDVTTSKDWVSITLPAGTGLYDGRTIHFNGTVQPMDLRFTIPTGNFSPPIWVSIRHFPYDAKYFYRRTPTSNVEIKSPLTLRVFPLSHPTTNWNALGQMTIISARPVFDYGLPSSNGVFAVQETPAPLTQTQSVFATNQVKPPENLRLVNGKLYNASDSKLWGNPIELAGVLPTSADNGHPIRYEIVAEQIEDDKIVCDFDAVTYWFETWTGKPQDESRQTLKAIVIYHYPNPRALVTGQIIVGVVNGAPVSFLAMRVQNFIENGLSLEAYDCGVPSKNIVP